jgi:hypothetical protein
MMWSKFEEATGRNRASFRDNDEQLNALIGYLFQPSAVDKGKAGTVKQTYNNVVRCVMTFITTAMKRRRILLG